ncbi:MAG: P-II family nitrogen regulator [Spirochaetales bacterium]|nr:P-II family nitrogen regulator [Spirochaetales bacterium]
MLMIRSIVRPEKSQEVMDALLDAGYPAVTKVSVAGRGQQRGIKIGEVTYDELPKDLLISVIRESDRELVVNTIVGAARTGDSGNYGDGKIFVSPVEEVYTISSGFKEA